MRYNRMILALYIGIVCIGLNQVEGQESVGERLETIIEDDLRTNLKKIDRWGLKQLLYTETQVDQVQKKRAQISTNSEELALLANDEDSGVRFYVAANRYTSLDILESLAADGVDYVRCGVANSLAYDPSAIEQIRNRVEKITMNLAVDTGLLIRLVLASNPELAPAVSLRLSADKDIMVREKLSGNLNISQDVLIHLAQDSVLTVRLNALVHKNIPFAILLEKSQDLDWQVRQAVSLNPNVSGTLLDRLSSDKKVEVRRQVALHARTLQKTLKAMIKDVDLQVLKALAEHPNADREILAKLAVHQDNEVRITAERRLEPILRREIREDVLERWNLN